MAERVCSRCGANCMSANWCRCGGQAFKEIHHEPLPPVKTIKRLQERAIDALQGEEEE